MDTGKTEAEFLKAYDASAFARPNASVDTAIFTVFDDALHVLLVKRAHHPFQNMWSLVGGFIDTQTDDDLEATAKRKLHEKTGVKTPYLEQYATIGNKQRDPRCWSLTTVYFALLPRSGIQLQAGTGATDIKWAKVTNGTIHEKLAFDHKDILKGCFQRLRHKVIYTSLPLYLMEAEFTLGELQRVYEILLDQSVDIKSFRRRIQSSGMVRETGTMKSSGRRPAKVYELAKPHETHYFPRNIEAVNL